MCKTTSKVHLPPGGALDGFFGMNRGGWFQCPSWVDVDKPPGYSSQPAVEAGWLWLLKYPLTTLNPKTFFFSVNAFWWVWALVGYFAVPYDFEASGAKTCGWDVFLDRLTVHMGINTAFYVTVLTSAYIMRYATRRFPGDEEGPPLSRFIHNVWYWFLGTVQGAMWDTLLVALYANKLVPYAKDSEAFSLSSAGLTTAVLTLMVPPIRDHGFFWGHMLLHHNYLYKYCHALHHRNVTLEAFCGLCMHPVEHLHYYAPTAYTVLLVWYFESSPFVPFFCLVHLMVAPAWGHSGWEDIWQSEQFHTLHHAKYECNYGGQSAPWDEVLGVFRETFGQSKYYKGAWAESDAPPMARAEDRQPLKKFLRGSPTLTGALYNTTDQALYDLLHVVLAYVLYAAVFDSKDPESVWRVAFPLEVADGVALTAPQAVGLLLAVGPHAIGALMWAMSDAKSWRWPFHEKPLASFVPCYLTAVTITSTPLYLFGTWAAQALAGF